MQFKYLPLDEEQIHECTPGIRDSSLDYPDTDSSPASSGTEDSLFSPVTSSSQSSMNSTMLNVTNADPLFVSPRNQEPSDNIAPYLSVIFPNVPERAQQNNILLTTKEAHCLEYYITQFDYYCPEYDVTIVIDGGRLIEKEIQSTIIELGLKEHNVHRVGESCVILMNQFTHEFGAKGLRDCATDLETFRYWNPMALDWGETAVKIKTGPICDFFDRFPQWGQSQFPEKIWKRVYEKKHPDSGSVPTYTYDICRALGMTPAPTLAIEGANSDDFRKLFRDCIIWVAGALLQLNAVIGVNNSPETCSVDILNFDLTVDRMMALAHKLEGEQYTSTRQVLHQVAKMKASIHVLQLKLLNYLLCNPELSKEVTQQDVHKVNDFIREDIELAIELCPILGIRPLEFSRFPEIDVDEVQPFLNDIKADLMHYKKVLNELYDCKVQMHPQEAVVQCAHILVFHTIPLTFGPISKQFIPPQGAKVEIPVRALAGIGNGYVDVSANCLQGYLRKFSPEQKIEERTFRHSEIPLEWIKDPGRLAANRGIAVQKMSPAKYNSRLTLRGKIKFRYLTDQALQHLLQTPDAVNINIVDDTSRKWAIWTLLRSQVQKATRNPLLEDVESQNNVEQELGYPWGWTEFGRAPTRLLPSSSHRRYQMDPNTRSRRIRRRIFSRQPTRVQCTTNHRQG
uniref:ARAD1A04686p n=1 Tax=Blastobotrys adeninivorans TaxID=409370 RepID=A0A060T241_BLAAD